MNDIQLQVNNAIISGNDILTAIDDVLDHLHTTGDLAPAENALKALVGVQEVSGLALAKLLHGLWKWWDETNQSENSNDDFVDWCYSVSTSVKPITIERYISVWDKHEKGLFTDRITARPLKDQIAIAKAMEQGYEFNKTQMKQLERAESNGEVLSIIRDVKGVEPRKSALIINMESGGSLWAWQNGEKFYVGFLNIEEEKTETIKKAIARITNNTGIRRK